MKTHLGHYEIVSEIGRGGMGVVYRAFEPALNRHVAIKELSPSLAHDPQLVERFLREARSMAALSDPHIIQIHYIGTDEATAQPFFAMEFVEGDSLSAILKRDGKLDVETALKVLHQTAQGLATAHDRGVIHRDIKPGNLMISDRGQVKIADFGIALATQDMSKKLTSTGEFVGTPGYLSPEVCLGKPIDQRSDIFSLGIVMFEMLSGHTPFSDESPLGLMLEVVKAEIPDIQQLNDDVDPQTAAILARMLAKEPEDRFQSCHDLVAALEAHPAVARGGTAIKLARPAAPVDAATVVGAPTPMSSARKVTPPPVVRSGASHAPPAAAVSDSAPTSASTRPSVLDRPATKRGALWLPLAVAAVLVLSVAGGAFAFRAPIMDFVKGFGDGFAGRSSERAYESGLATGQASNPISTSQAATSLTADTSTDSSSASGSLSSDALDAIAQDQPIDSSAQTALENPAESTGNTVTQAENTVASTPAATNASIAAAQTTVSGNAPDSAANIPPAAAASKSRTVATTAAPARPAAPPPPPRVAVIAIGDSAITGPARSRIESQLAASGFDLVDADALGVYGDDLSSALNSLRHSASVAVVVRAEPVGSQELQYYGRVSEMYTANLTVRAYKTSDRTPIGSGLREKVQFTTLNADTQAQGALAGGKLDRLVAELSPWRRRG